MPPSLQDKDLLELLLSHTISPNFSDPLVLNLSQLDIGQRWDEIWLLQKRRVLSLSPRDLLFHNYAAVGTTGLFLGLFIFIDVAIRLQTRVAENTFVYI
ncbi:hypothetical protein PM082_017503 [Marasmius tenuissimus]|nr:hypothetical protein PM082_017503 [Marasmius tenuissimus]